MSRKILSSFIGMRVPTEQLPTIGNGFGFGITFFRNDKKKRGLW